MGIFTLVNSSLWSIGPFMGAVAYQYGGATSLFLAAIVSGIASVVAIYIFYTSYRKRPIAVGSA